MDVNQNKMTEFCFNISLKKLCMDIILSEIKISFNFTLSPYIYFKVLLMCLANSLNVGRTPSNLDMVLLLTSLREILTLSTVDTKIRQHSG